MSGSPSPREAGDPQRKRVPMLTLPQIIDRLTTPEMVTDARQVIPYRIDVQYLGDGRFGIEVEHHRVHDSFPMTEAGVEDALDAARQVFEEEEDRHDRYEPET